MDSENLETDASSSSISATFELGQPQRKKTKSSIRSFLEGYPRWKEAVFLTSIAGMGMLFGFGASVTSSKKKDPEAFDKGFTTVSRKLEFESGPALATRALKWGTFYAVTGCGLIFFAIWKLVGAKDLKEFRLKVGEFLPRIPKNQPQGRTEFANLTELLQYVIDEDNRAKAEKLKVTQMSGNVDKSSGSSLVSSETNAGSVEVSRISDLQTDRDSQFLTTET